MKSTPFFKTSSPQSRTACWLAASTTTSGLSFSSAFRLSTTATFLPTAFCVALTRAGRTRTPTMSMGGFFARNTSNSIWLMAP